MATMNISLPQQMKDWVEAQTADGRYANSSDYIRDLIRRDVELRSELEADRIEIAARMARFEETGEALDHGDVLATLRQRASGDKPA